MKRLIPLVTSLAGSVVLVSAANATASRVAYVNDTTSASSAYEVHVRDKDNQFGSWNAVTGSSHPTGAGNNLLFRGTTTVTNFSSLRIFESAARGGNRDYTFGGEGGGINLDNYVGFQGGSPFAPARQGYRTTWNVTPENLAITQDVFAVGSNFNNSAIYHSVELTNTGSSSIQLGWRNLYDWDISNTGGGSSDDGPSNQIEMSNGSVAVAQTVTEFSYSPTPNSFVRVSTPDTQQYQVLLGLGYELEFLPTISEGQPDEYAYVSWSNASGSAFDYIVNPRLDVANGGGIDDSAGLSWFGRDEARARKIAPGQSVRFTQALFAVVRGGSLHRVTSIPEPSPVSGILAIGVLGALSLLKRKRQQKL